MRVPSFISLLDTSGCKRQLAQKLKPVSSFF